MADPIRLPNSTPKEFSTAKVTRTARQKFKNRQKRRRRKQDRRQPSDKEQGRSDMNHDDSGVYTRTSRDKKFVEKVPKNRRTGHPGRDQGNVIDVRI